MLFQNPAMKSHAHHQNMVWRPSSQCIQKAHYVLAQLKTAPSKRENDALQPMQVPQVGPLSNLAAGFMIPLVVDERPGGVWRLNSPVAAMRQLRDESARKVKNEAECIIWFAAVAAGTQTPDTYQVAQASSR